MPSPVDSASIQGFISKYGVSGFEHTYDPEGLIWANYEIFFQPATIFINDDGSQELVPGAIDEQVLIKKVENLIAS